MATIAAKTGGSEMRNYEKGRRLEYVLKEQLERQGCFVVRSAGSRGPADLVAIKGGKATLIQVQKRSHLPKEKENALKLAAKKAGCDAYLAYRVQRKWVFRRVYPEGFERGHILLVSSHDYHDGEDSSDG